VLWRKTMYLAQALEDTGRLGVCGLNNRGYLFNTRELPRLKLCFDTLDEGSKAGQQFAGAAWMRVR